MNDTPSYIQKDVIEVRAATNFPSCIASVVASYIIRGTECLSCCDFAINADFRQSDRHAAKIYCRYVKAHKNVSRTIFHERYLGYWSNMADLARWECNNIYYNSLSSLPSWMTDTIDWVVAWPHIEHRYIIKCGHVFLKT
jgi:hypothetical protein